MDNTKLSDLVIRQAYIRCNEVYMTPTAEQFMSELVRQLKMENDTFEVRIYMELISADMTQVLERRRQKQFEKRYPYR